MDELDDFLGNLKGVLDRLEDAEEFFSVNRARYLRLAQEVAGQVLNVLRPPEIEVDVWERRIVAVRRNILYSLLQNRQGFNISYDGEVRAPADERGGGDGISREDVMEWVMAGLAGDPEGKDITKHEGSSRSPGRIADTVYQAVSSPGLGLGEKDYGKLKSQIESYYAREVGTGLGAFMEAVLDSWLNAFVVILERDFSEWVDGELRRI